MLLRIYGISAALAGSVALLAASPGPRQSTPTASRVVRPAPPAIDRGLRAEDLTVTQAPRLAAADAGPPYVAGQVLVKLRAGVASTSLAVVARSVGGAPTAPLSYANFHVISIDPSADPERIALELADHPDVEYAQPSYRAKLHQAPDDPLYDRQWNLPAIGMDLAADVSRRGTSEVIVAVLDSGMAFENVVMRFETLPFTAVFDDGRRQLIDYGVLDVPFAAATDLVAPGRIVSPYDFTWDDVHPLDTLGHGTHVAGTIGQLTNNGVGAAGMASTVKLMPVKIAAASSWDVIFRAPFPDFTDDRVARAIRYAADNGAKVINMSFGRTGAAAPVVDDAVRYAVSRGAFCVSSAGNDALTGSPPERYAEVAARVDGAVAVGAVGRTLDRARYSSVGPWVEISAPGGDVSQGGTAGGVLQQTLDSSLFVNPLVAPRFDAMVYQFSQGTSTAAAHVTGFAALLIQQGITSPAEIEVAMKRFATDRGPAGRDDEYGAGIINPRATLRGLGLAR
jgi:serine protease